MFRAAALRRGINRLWLRLSLEEGREGQEGYVGQYVINLW
jgi:hypothetical protein